jgi:translation initiation factor IF-1
VIGGFSHNRCPCRARRTARRPLRELLGVSQRARIQFLFMKIRAIEFWNSRRPSPDIGEHPAIPNHTILVPATLFLHKMAPVPTTTTQKDAAVTEGTGAQDLSAQASTGDESLYKVPENYFFHNKVHIEEGDVVIVFMVSLSFEQAREVSSTEPEPLP